MIELDNNFRERQIALFGSTGSIGKQAAQVAKFHGIRIECLTANSDVKTLEEQIRMFSPAMCVVVNEKKAQELKVSVADTKTRIYGGEEALEWAAGESKSELMLNSVIGKAGLRPTLAAIRSGKNIALANKETLVVAGDIVKNEIKEHGVKLLPVDSEHCAIMQCLEGNNKKQLKKLILTASGGPFFGKKRKELEKVSPEIALAHPTWKMGQKITIDSATLMNKGFEVIEACHLFDVDVDKIEVCVHFESIIHSMAEYIDNAVIAQLGVPDMRTCIQYALTYPDRYPGLEKELDFATLGKLTFEKPDLKTFVLLPLAYEAKRRGGVIPAVMNGANEEAVKLFLDGKISFTDIFDLVKKVTDDYENSDILTLEEIEKADIISREKVKQLANC